MQPTKAVKKIWMDGRFVSWKEAKIHILTHTFHYGGGAFEGIRFYQTKYGRAIFRLQDHLDRLYHSAACLKMKVPYTQKDMKKAIIKLIQINKMKEGYIRPIIYYGYGHMGVSPLGNPVNVAIILWQWDRYLGTKPVRAKISPFIRIHPKSTFPEAKICGHYVNSILASIDAHSNGYDEAILLDYKGNVAEGPGENIFIVKNNTLVTPPLDNILNGITRRSIIEIAKKEKIRVKEKKISKRVLLKADEVFYSGTAAEISPLMSINDTNIKKPVPGLITKKMKMIFTKAVHAEIPAYHKWLTFIDSIKK